MTIWVWRKGESDPVEFLSATAEIVDRTLVIFDNQDKPVAFFTLDEISRWSGPRRAVA